ncbi:MAG: hypothetical protein KBA53_00210 [Thermoclostridium sp.]|nr:hypothetical protein [Thermoclostridium sp.]
MFERDYELKGKHATYTKYLRDTAGLFVRFIDVYMVAAVIGFLHGRRAERDTGGNDAAKMFADLFIVERDKLEFIYRLIMLLDTTTGLTADQRVDRAFRDDTNEEAMKRNMLLFNSYVLGGMEILYEKFSTNCTTSDDYINALFVYVTGFKNELDGVSEDDLLVKLL